MGINKGYLTCGTDSSSDEVLTPRYAIYPVIEYLQAKQFKNILCPFDKDNSKYVEVLKNNGFNVVNTHLETKDFFNYTKQELINIDCIVSNPPFSIKDEVLDRLYELDKPFMILLPQNSLQSQKRTKLFIKYGIEYLGFDSRICFYTQSYILDENKNKVFSFTEKDLSEVKTANHFASGYFCHNVLPEKLIFKELKLIQERY